MLAAKDALGEAWPDGPVHMLPAGGYRTAKSLEARGLVTLRRRSRPAVVALTGPGRAVAKGDES